MTVDRALATRASPNLRRLAHAVEALFPMPVVSELAPVTAEVAVSVRMLAEAILPQASPARRREFAVARECARHAARRLGVQDALIARGPHGQPVWPSGIVGSITHDSDICVASASLSGHAVSIGIDLLDLGRVRRFSQYPSATDMLKYAMSFSLKEAVFKCVWPLMRAPESFQDIALDVSPDQSITCVRIGDGKLGKALEGRVFGHCIVVCDRVLSAAWLNN